MIITIINYYPVNVTNFYIRRYLQKVGLTIIWTFKEHANLKQTLCWRASIFLNYLFIKLFIRCSLLSYSWPLAVLIPEIITYCYWDHLGKDGVSFESIVHSHRSSALWWHSDTFNWHPTCVWNLQLDWRPTPRSSSSARRSILCIGVKVWLSFFPSRQVLYIRSDYSSPLYSKVRHVLSNNKLVMRFANEVIQNYDE